MQERLAAGMQEQRQAYRIVSSRYLSDNGPRKMVVKSGILYVSCLNNTVTSIDLRQENITLRAPTTKFGNCGHGIAIDSNSIIYVADYDNDMIRYIKANDQVIDIILTKYPVDVATDFYGAIYYIYKYQYIVKYYKNRITYLGSSNVYNCLTEIKIDSKNNIFLLDPCNADGNFIWKIPFNDQNQREGIPLHSCISGDKISAMAINSEDDIAVTLLDEECSYVYLINPNQSSNMTQLCLPNKKMNISGMVFDKSNDYLYVSDMVNNKIYEVTDYCLATGSNVCTPYPADERSSSVNDKDQENLYGLFALFAILPIFAIAFYYYWYPRGRNGKEKTPVLSTDTRRI